jgi:peroxiredoxin
MRGLLLTGVILTCALCATGSAAPPSLLGKEAPDFALRAMDGHNVRLSEYRGEVVLVNFWARWEGDSRQQMQALDHINVTYQRAGLVVIGISVDEDQRRAREFATSMAVSYPILFDTGATIGKDYLLQKMPVTLLIDRSGVVRYSVVGYKRGDEQAYLEQIRALLRE